MDNWPVWATEEVEIQSPNPEWLEKGRQERERLLELLLPLGILEVEHIGSTSIPGLPAKPIIDIMASTEAFHNLNEIIDVLSQFDWHYVPPELDGREWRRFFVKVRDDKRAAHLHLMLKNEERWGQQLQFRDILRKDYDLVNEYSEIKVRLAQQFKNDREAYTEAKTHFIQNVWRGASGV
ncbi:GrpB family protein [Paenibacillus sedimenti]|uniref:GrpB family protein n=1 Tax=Paenibacillus sedimenti TaxID=2770274 RepID=A0A926QHW2_9BACL|nr:GrpB family protein [Paenibacillus sedimenti]MBD0378958.1 GrpB family protein [Paenibacillus sedimenti]